MDIVNDIVWHSFLLFLWGGNVFAALVGLGILIAPSGMLRINSLMSRWIETNRVTAQLDQPRWLERYAYRHHRIFGTLLGVGSAFVLYAFLLRPTKEKIAVLARNDLFGFLDAGIAFLVIVAVIGCVIGAVMVSKPSVLKEIEASANRWIGTEHIHAMLNRSYISIEHDLASKKLIVGPILLLGGSFVAFRLGQVLFNGQWML